MKKVLLGLAVIASLGFTGCTSTQTTSKPSKIVHGYYQDKPTKVELETFHNITTELKLAGHDKINIDYGNFYVIRYVKDGSFDVIANLHSMDDNFGRRYDKDGNFIKDLELGDTWIYDLRAFYESNNIDVYIYRK